MSSTTLTPETVLKKANNADSETLKSLAESLPPELISEWLMHPNWKVRNSAVKIVGALRLVSFKENLIEFIIDRTPARFLVRLFGGDFHQVGFIRRNAVRALGATTVPDQKVTAALLTSLTDSYWEVRAEGLKALRNMYIECSTPEVISAVAGALRDSTFEVVEQALYTLGTLCQSADILPIIRNLYNHSNNLVKSAAVESLKTLHRRGVIGSRNDLTKELNNIFIPGHYNNNSH